jgi:S1-C subfamily serine protease
MIGFACSQCGKNFQVKDEFAGKRAKCSKCGAVTQVPMPANPPTVPPAASQPSLTTPSISKFCSSCGNPLHGNPRFCGACGHQVGVDQARSSVGIVQEPQVRPQPEPGFSPIRAEKSQPEKAVAPPGKSWKDIIACRKIQVVLIEHTKGIGAGLLISPDGLIVTNKHVIDSASSLQITFSNNTETRGIVLHSHTHLDLAIVRAAIRNAPFLHLDQDWNEQLAEGDEVIAIGHPQGLPFTSTKGIISVLRQRLGSQYFIQHDVAINPGNSGGPLFDTDGKLVGLNTLIRKDSQGLGFAIPVADVRAYFKTVTKAIEDGQLKVPTNEEILESQLSLTPEQVLLAAVMSFDGTKEELKDGGYVITTQQGISAAVWLLDQHFECVSQLAELKSSALEDASFMRQLLEINGKLIQPKLALDPKGILWVESRRLAAGLEPVELYCEIDAVLCTAAAYLKPIRDYLSRPQPFSREDLRRYVQSCDSESRIICPVCRVEVKAKNLLRHCDEVHREYYL